MDRLAERREGDKGRPGSDAGRNPGVENVLVDARIGFGTLTYGEWTGRVAVSTE